MHPSHDSEETVTPTRITVHKLKVAEIAIERIMLGVTLRYKIPNSVIRWRSGVENVSERKTMLKWNKAGHEARVMDSWWIKTWPMAKEDLRMETLNTGQQKPSTTTDKMDIWYKLRLAINWIQVVQNQTIWAVVDIRGYLMMIYIYIYYKFWQMITSVIVKFGLHNLEGSFVKNILDISPYNLLLIISFFEYTLYPFQLYFPCNNMNYRKLFIVISI